MHPWLDRSHELLLVPFIKFILDNDITRALCQEEHQVLRTIRNDDISLDHQLLLRRLKHSFHALDNILQNFGLMLLGLDGVLFEVRFEELLCYWVSFDSIFENVNRTQHSVSLRNSLPHEVSQLCLENLRRIRRLEELGYLSSQVLVDVKGFHSSVYRIQFSLKLGVLFIQLVHVQGHVTDDETI